MNHLTALLCTVGWMISFVIMLLVAVIGTSFAPNPDAPIYVIIAGAVNLIAYAVLTHHYLKLKYLCDKFIED